MQETWPGVSLFLPGLSRMANRNAGLPFKSLNINYVADSDFMVYFKKAGRQKQYADVVG
jgi:hypothetical protein